MTRAAILALCLAAGPAGAQQPACAQIDAIRRGLLAEYGEVAMLRGRTPAGETVTLFVSPGSGTWTLVVTRTDGMTCAMASGTALEAILDAPGVDG